jgi:flagellar basal-body rod modification protein FlgD
MSIAALEPTYNQTPGAETHDRAESTDALGRDQFLTMLVAQLKHQDPLNPLEGTDFTAQLAQFSSLEQLFGVNDKLTEIQDELNGQENGNHLDYIGKTVKTNDSTISVKGGQTDSVTYTLSDRANVTILVHNEDGLEARRIYVGRQNAGEHDLDWDGRDNEGNLVGDGMYTFEVEAIDDSGLIVPHDAYVAGEVTGVTYESGMPYLMIGDKLVTPGNIIEVRK